MYTQCPSCQTIFKVSAAHLKIANGKVRCGQCSAVFSALDTLVEIDETPPPSQPPPSEPKERDNDVFESIADTTSTFDQIDIPGIEGDSPVVPDAGQEPAPVPSSDDPLDFAADSNIFSQAVPVDALDSVPANEESPLGALDFEPDASGGTPSSNELAENNLDFDLGGDVTAQTGDAPNSQAVTLNGQEIDFDLGGDEPARAPEQAAEVKSEDKAFAEVIEEKVESPAEPETKDKSEEKKSAKSSKKYILEELGDEPPSKWSWLVTVFWTTLITLLLAVLLLQFAYFKRDELAKYPEIRPYLEDICGIASRYVECEIPQPRDVKAIAFLESIVSPHPNRANALLIVATLENKAKFTQPYPTFQINFSDFNQKIVATRDFKPEEYLSKDVKRQKGMKPSVPVRIMVEIVDPGSEAVNFDFILK